MSESMASCRGREKNNNKKLFTMYVWKIVHPINSDIALEKQTTI